MSAPEEDPKELKAGHAPAVKVGGMRITQHKAAHSQEKAPEAKKEEKAEGEEGEEEGEEEALEPKHNLVISGAVTRGDADFPPEALKAFHEKPVAAHDFRSGNSKPTFLNQPRKFN